MKKFFLHIGLPRCASTTIETVFLMPDEEGTQRLRQSRIEPLLGLHDEFRAAAFGPAWEMDFRDRLHQQYLAPQLENDSIDGLFTSDESLSLTYSEEATPPDLSQRAEFLGNLLDGFDVTIFAVIRNQVDYIESLYGLHVQRGGRSGFLDFVNGLALPDLDWHYVMQTYAQVFGKDRMVVVPLESGAYTNSGASRSNFLEALQNVMGVENPLAADEVKIFNPSLPRVLMPVQAQINQEIDKEVAIRVAEILRTSLRKGATADVSLFGANQKVYMRSIFADANRKLFEDFLPDFDPNTYL